MNKLKVAVHKFASCDGCQLALLTMGEDLLTLKEFVDFVHFAEAGPIDETAKVDIAFVEGSISTPKDETRIQKIRKNTTYLITIGACATAGGIQALRNLSDGDAWTQAIYAKPDYISSLATSTPISHHVKVDLELWGCPINTQQILDVMTVLIQGVKPNIRRESVCIACKRAGNVCVLVTEKKPCMGPVTQTGCKALCPSVNRDCYACYGPQDTPNSSSLSQYFMKQGLSKEAIRRRFLFINNGAPTFKNIDITLSQNKDKS